MIGDLNEGRVAMIDLDAIAEELDRATAQATLTGQISNRYDGLTLADAYEIQKRTIDRRLDRGEHLVGVKMGFTSQAKMIQMGLSDQIWGRLTDGMVIEDGGVLDPHRFIHPRVEPELAVRLKAPLHGPVSEAEAWDAVDSVAAALEVIDSRYKDFRFSLTDVVADNASSSAFVVGPWQSPDIDISDLAMELSIDGETRQTGSSAAILGHPVKSLVAAARLAGEAGLTLESGWIVMLGGATSAEALAGAQHVNLEAEILGSVGFGIGGAAG